MLISIEDVMIISITDIGVVISGIAIAIGLFALCIIKSIQNGIFKDDSDTLLILQSYQDQIDNLKSEIGAKSNGRYRYKH